MGRQKELVSRCGEMLHIRYRLLRQALAECLGTLILVVSGGSPGACQLQRGNTPPPPRSCLSTQGAVIFQTSGLDLTGRWAGRWG